MNPMIEPIIRPAVSNDVSEIIELCKLHAAYEKAEYNTSGKKEKLSASLFSDTPALFCLVVESDKNILGYATYMKQYSTWDACFYIYMDCLFIKEAYRGNRLGEKLVARIKEEAKLLNCDLIQWQTPEFNTRAIKFYYRIGATSKSKERFFLETE